jgi:hypothetical protein
MSINPKKPERRWDFNSQPVTDFYKRKSPAGSGEAFAFCVEPGYAAPTPVQGESRCFGLTNCSRKFLPIAFRGRTGRINPG